MSLSAKVGGVWKDGATLSAKVSGAWKTVSSGWLKVGGVWKQFYAGLAAAVTGDLTNSSPILFPPSPESVSVVASLDITGTAPYTYLWSYTGFPSTVSSTSGSTFTLTLTDGDPVEASGTVECQVSDSYGNVVTTAAAAWSLSLYTLD